MEVEFHLGGDMKSLWLALNVHTGTNGKCRCPFCAAEMNHGGVHHMTVFRPPPADAQGPPLPDDDLVKRRAPPPRTCECDFASPDGRPRDPLFGVPLANQHFCALHAVMRVVEKQFKFMVRYCCLFWLDTHPRCSCLNAKLK